MDEGGFVRILRRPPSLPPSPPDAGLPLPVAILVELLRDRADIPAVIDPMAPPKRHRI
jgi:hypothetical protein